MIDSAKTTVELPAPASGVEGRAIVSLGGVDLDGEIDNFGAVRGVQRVRFEVPANVPAGLLPLSVRVNGETSNVVSLAVAGQQ